MGSRIRVLRNLARGSGKFHFHRREIIRGILDSAGAERQSLSVFLAASFFSLPDGWSVFNFSPKDWPLGDRLIACRHPAVEARLLEMILDYADANADAVTRLYALSATASNQLLRRNVVQIEAGNDELDAADAQSLFGLRMKCAANQAATDAVIGAVEQGLPLKSWARSRLVHPMVYHFSHTPPAASLDNFLSYIVTGKEHDAEKLALKLMLSDEAARECSLAFRCFIGLMGHPFDAIEFVIDHVENEIASGRALASHLERFITEIALRQPGSRAGMISSVMLGQVDFLEGTRPEGLAQRFEIPEQDLEAYASLCNVSPLGHASNPESTRPLDVLTRMRANEYPEPSDFHFIWVNHAVWHFIDGGRFIGALLRSVYMVDRAASDLEVRASFRLMCFLGFASPFLASAPSAMIMLRRLHRNGVNVPPSDDIETRTDQQLHRRAPFKDRLWINELQWRLRRLEEDGRIEQWLKVVRSETRLRPSYLTGINWHWVEEIIATRRLKPFRNLDGAFLFIHMELEANTDPLRLRLTLEPLLKGKEFGDAVRTIISEFGAAAGALVRRYLTTQNLLAVGFAPNYLAALDQRVRAMEAYIRQFKFNPLLTEEVYESEVKALTAELFLTDVNAGKFEIPWETFRKDANDANQELYHAAESLRRPLDGAAPLTAIVETPLAFPNGRTQTFKVRQRDQALFACVMAVLKDFMQHPAFGLEVILSGRFRHNNLIQELWAAMADVIGATIPSVSQHAKAALIDDYKLAAERTVDGWCASRLQTRRPEKPAALFDLIPDSREVEALLGLAKDVDGMLAITDVVIEWIKAKMRTQVASARSAFEQEVATELSASFAEVRAQQLSGGNYRDADVHLVFNAVNDAVQRRIGDLGHWFDGVDSATSGPISLGHLGLAAEALFENMIPGKTLALKLDRDAECVSFPPHHVKIAFDLVRELCYNAIRRGAGPNVEVVVEGVAGQQGMFRFRNDCSPCASDEIGEQTVEGHVYHGRNEAVTREGNSGLPKIAASSATLVGKDASIRCVRTERDYEVLVALRPEGQG